MATSLPSPPISRSSTPGLKPNDDNDADFAGDVAAKLDALLEQYLGLLDKYTLLREELSRTFSDGFFTLAQAQRNSSLGPGRRYGPDFYDQRMKARRRSKVNGEDKELKISLEAEEVETKAQREACGPENGGSEVLEDSHTDESQEQGKELQGSRTTHDERKVASQEVRQRVKQEPGHRDPLTWFGLLVPPALRQTQSHFSQAVETSMPALLNIDLRMRSLEKQIWACRRELAEETETETAESDSEVGAKDQKPLEEPEKQKTSTAQRNVPSRRAQLTSRSIHARSQLLKLGDREKSCTCLN